MFAIIALFLLLVFLVVRMRSLLSAITKKETLEYNRLKAESENCLKENERLKSINLGLDKEANETIVLYEMTREVCKTLDEEQIFKVFKERAFELNEADDEKFDILANQFALGFKRAVLYKKVQELAITDSLTQALSRRYFIERFDEEIERSKKFNLNFSLLIVDIDRFKEYNDRYGHLVGDVILREVSATIKAGIREIDLIGRYGGDEFLLLLTETDKNGARFVAERIRESIEARQFQAYDESLKGTISVGISCFPEDSHYWQGLIEKADKALYQAKQAGRNRVC
jgi:diguanylate cyclase (GGDEF)-like protein